MSKISLVIMAAGIGSRFGGGIKQLTGFGPCGEIIMDYSVHDALEAGFDQIIFVIRKDLEKDFKEIIGNRISRFAPVRYAFQELTDLPEGFTLPEGRKKPWGTGQAILACRGLTDGPFAVINADDYYGKDAFRKVYGFLAENLQTAAGREKQPLHICMAGFILKNTLSKNGGVTRGICRTDESGSLTGIEETKNIFLTEDERAVVKTEGAPDRELDPENLVSMNFWGFPEAFIDELSTGFPAFLSSLDQHELNSREYLLPIIVDELLRSRKACVSVLPSKDHWFGVTYQEDVPVVKAAFRELTEAEIYPAKLWNM